MSEKMKSVIGSLLRQDRLKIDREEGNSKVIDLRSDFLSRPTPKMIEAMMKAAQSTCSFGLREDPYQKRLEELAANILGKEDALFFPTCTMCNQTAIHIFCSPGEKFIAEATSHVIFSEAGAPASLSGVMPIPIRGDMGCMDLKTMEEAIDPGDVQRSRSSLIILENTHVWAGGTVLSPLQMKQFREVAHRYQIPIHLDGARVFNAAVYFNMPTAELTRDADSVSVSLNKGLSAPMGAVLAGSQSFIQEALRVRQMFGGGWRPTNILSAAGIVALETMINRLAEDHINARRLAEGLNGCPGVSVDLRRVQTNLVVVKIDHAKLTLRGFIEALTKQGVLVIPFGSNALRMAIHWEVTEKEVNNVIETFHRIAEG